MRGVALAAVVLVAALAGGASSATTKPALRLIDSSPLTVKGVAFKSRERVRVVASYEGERTSKAVRATRRGTLTVVFEETSLRCGFSVRAFGAAGSLASLKLPQTLCPPPLARP